MEQYRVKAKSDLGPSTRPRDYVMAVGFGQPGHWGWVTDPGGMHTHDWNKLVVVSFEFALHVLLSQPLEVQISALFE